MIAQEQGSKNGSKRWSVRCPNSFQTVDLTGLGFTDVNPRGITMIPEGDVMRLIAGTAAFEPSPIA